MMILVFPSNPTAQCVELNFLRKWLRWLAFDVLVDHDLAYADTFMMAGKRHQLCRCRVPVMWRLSFALSKSYNMAGWRIGFMVETKRW
ncbi:aminotransferase class I/II-fold pyridoxal phosphate-dependent enzyme [Shigella flexneri]